MCPELLREIRKVLTSRPPLRTRFGLKPFMKTYDAVNRHAGRPAISHHPAQLAQSDRVDPADSLAPLATQTQIAAGAMRGP